MVEVEFSVGPRNYLIRRGIKPNVFDILVDGEMKNKEADDRANQKIVEEQILKLNYKSFTQIVIWVVVTLCLYAIDKYIVER